MLHWTVIEIKQQLALTDAGGSPVFKSCWNIVFKAPYIDELDAPEVFNGCLVWIETNRVKGSEYVITEMFFV